ncbi:NAD(P)/FAD-dependent oxidoreductase [Enorma phocaeensis]|uniref:NAD(P)/FAD-dependent oxidoreductase n=1 Tax=Enorma phocaeensis TaxID=1871019 RepID=A0A921LVL7_9ACTN|nr:NAD(P)/FAD-dependent oxidoreductase [Enorma phocaeensis]HJG38045.1 NAD(P)/FAD-dependent oxidoreductase [Enorma phocaeensis]
MSPKATRSYDAIVVGGGASGLAAALAAAREGARVAIIERDVELGLPILATGNGRCNLSNEDLRPARYRHPVIARAVMGEHPEEELSAWFTSVGIWTTTEWGRLYPASKRAESVRDALLGACERAGVEAMLCQKLMRASWDADGARWRLESLAPATPLHAPRARDEHARLRALRRALAQAPLASSTFETRSVILAPGGSSGATATLFDVPHLEERPVLCPIACSPATSSNALGPDALARLDGIRADVRLTLVRDGIPLWSEEGEVLFRAYGLSGIAAFNLSRRIERDDIIEVDLFPSLDESTLRQRLREREDIVGAFAPKRADWFDGVLAPALGKAVIDAAGACNRCAQTAKHLAFRVRGTTEPKSAQVHQGGIPFSAVDTSTLAVTSSAGGQLFACGEALDMDADCGGFNLAWAWLSGIRAGTAAARAAANSSGA